MNYWLSSHNMVKVIAEHEAVIMKVKDLIDMYFVKCLEVPPKKKLLVVNSYTLRPI